MAGIKISDLPAVVTPALSDVFPIDQGAVTYKESAQQLLSLFQANGAALTSVNDTNVTMTLGGSPATALLNAASMTLGWTGQLSVARGGTGLAAITAHYLPIGNGTSALTLLAPSATSGVALISQGAAADPAYGTVVVAGGGTGLTSITAHYIPIGNGTSPPTLLAPSATSGIPLISQGAAADPAYGTAVVAGGGTGIATTTPYSVICAGTTATGPFQSLASLGNAGEQLTSNGPGALPTWQPSSTVTPSALTEVNDTNVTLTLGGTPATALLQAVSITAGWAGQLAATRGGTGIGTYTLGDTLYSSAANTLAKLAGNTTTTKQYLSQTGDGANSAAPAWATIDGTDITGAALTKTDDTNVTMTLGGTPTTALLRAASMTLGWTGTLSVARGGTGAGTFTGLLTGNGTSAFTATAITQYNVLTGGASNLPNSVAPSATSGVPLISQGAAAQPVFGTAVVAGGGTGLTSATAYAVLCGGTTSTGAFQSIASVGTSGQALLSNGAGALPSFQTLTSFTSIAIQRITATGAFTYTPTTGTKYAIFELVGGGGGSGGTTGAGGQQACGGAGAAGSYLKILVTGSSNLAAVTGSIGGGGSAGASGNNAGGAGGNTTLTINSGTQWVAAGGNGGAGQAASTNVQSSGQPGASNANTTGTNATLIENVQGEPGSWGFTNGASFGGVGATGGLSRLGSGGVSGQAGIGNGGGAGGYNNFTGSNSVGFAGGGGLCLITEFI